MNDVVAEVEESRRGAMVRFEGGERLWFGRGAWLERSPLRPGDVEDLDVLKQWLLPRQYPQALAGAGRPLAARGRPPGGNFWKPPRRYKLAHRPTFHHFSREEQAAYERNYYLLHPEKRKRKRETV
mgnify:CR=1 FL=1